MVLSGCVSVLQVRVWSNHDDLLWDDHCCAQYGGVLCSLNLGVRILTLLGAVDKERQFVAFKYHILNIPSLVVLFVIPELLD